MVCAVTGRRGVGKTQVAAAYARQRIADRWDLVAWVNADKADRLLADLAAIATALGVQDREGDSAVSSGNLTRHLIARRSAGVIVFDNATDPDLISAYLLPAGSIQIVITTTNQAFTDELGIAVAVDTFTRAESLQYLGDRTGL